MPGNNGNPAGQGWAMDGNENSGGNDCQVLPGAETLSVAEAAALLEMSPRTLRDRIKKGKVPAEDTTEGYRIATATVEALQARLLGNLRAVGNVAGQQSATSANGATLPGNAAGDVARLISAYEELFQAQEAARERERELSEEAAEERTGRQVAETALARADEERGFLRERLVAAETAATESRVLFLNTQQALEAATARAEAAEQAALPAPAPPDPPRPWWQFWRR